MRKSHSRMVACKWIILLVFIPDVFCTYLSDSKPRVSSLEYLTSTCNYTRLCDVPHSLCYDSICTCESGYVNDASQTKCLKVAVGYHDACEQNVQCIEFLGNGGICANKKCVCKDFYHYLHGRCHRTRIVNEICNDDDECFEGSEYQATSCKKGFCECNEGFYQRESSACRRNVKNVDDECILDSDCDFESGICVTHKCAIDRNPLNASFTNIGKRYNFQKADGIEIGSECQGDIDCQSIANSICDVNKTCICKRAHFPSEEMTGCVPEIGEACDQDKIDLQVEHAVCRENMWTCPITRVTSKDNRHCIKLFEEIEQTCQNDEECQLFGPRSECSNNKCKCDTASHFIKEKHFCWLNHYLGHTCSFDDECYSLGNGYKLRCDKVNGCVCPDGWHANENRWYCLKDKPELGTYCEKDKDCGVKNSICQKNECACRKNYLEIDRKCWAELDGECTTSNECFTTNSHCKDGRCICIPNYSPIEGECNSSIIALPLFFLIAIILLGSQVLL